MSNGKHRKFYAKTVLWLTLFFLFALFTYAQEGLLIYGKLNIEGGSVKGSKIIIKKNGRTIETLENTSKFEYELDLGAQYLLVFEKEGYVTKSVSFNTKVPADRAELGFAPFGFNVTLFEQYEGVNIIIFNQPVGKIHFNPDIDDFDYDTDYTKSIQAALQQAEEELKQKKKEEEKRRKAEEEAKRKAEEEAKRKAAEEAKRKAEEEKKRKAEEEKKKKAAEEAKRKAEEEAKKKAEEEAKRKAKEEAEKRKQLEAQKKEEERKKLEAQKEAERLAKLKAKEEAEKRKQLEAQKKEEERKKNQQAQADEDNRKNIQAGINEEEKKKNQQYKIDNEERTQTPVQTNIEAENKNTNISPQSGSKDKASSSKAIAGGGRVEKPPVTAQPGGDPKRRQLVEQSKEEARKKAMQAKMEEEKRRKQMLAQLEESRKSELSTKYPEGKTEEVKIEGNKKITYIYINKNGIVTVYRKVEHHWGAVYYFKEERPISKAVFDIETQL